MNFSAVWDRSLISAEDSCSWSENSWFWFCHYEILSAKIVGFWQQGNICCQTL